MAQVESRVTLPRRFRDLNPAPTWLFENQRYGDYRIRRNPAQSHMALMVRLRFEAGEQPERRCSIRSEVEFRVLIFDKNFI